MAGHYSGTLPAEPTAAVQVVLRDGDLQGVLLISGERCELRRA